MKTYIILLLFAITIPVAAQSTYESVISQIEHNSITLQALRQQMEAQQLENRTGIYLSNPEVGFNYLWESPGSDNRTDLSITQAFDFPTAYAHKSKVAKGRNEIIAYTYESQRKELLLQAGSIYVELVYSNRQKEELDKRLQHAQSIATAYQERFARGDADVLERNKAQLNLLSAKKLLEANQIERNALQAALENLNGGQPLEFNNVYYPAYLIPQDFEQWYEQAQQRNPALQMAAREVEVSRRQEKLNLAMSLPKLSAGYMSERVPGSTQQGVTLGMSIPLWENKNQIKLAKMQTVALQNVEADTRLQFYNTLKTQHAKAVSLQTLTADYRQLLESSNNADLLKKAFDQRQLSLINYIMELSIYYDASDQQLQAERDSWIATIELMQWEM